MMKQLVLQSLGVVILAAVAGAQEPGQLATKGPTSINSRRPLADAAWLLEHLYGKVVTYEEPVLTWSGELEPQNGRDPSLKWSIAAKPQAFIMPADTGIEPDVAKVLDETLQAYHQQTTVTHFKVLVSDFGYHIVPVQAHDESGKFVPTGSLLDARITIPNEARTPVQHYVAILAAITSATGTKVNAGATAGRGFNELFRDSPARFVWGGSGAVARDALINLLKRSSPTMLWGLWCQPNAKAEDRGCALNMNMLEVTAVDQQGNPANRVIMFDRCGDCPPLGRPQPPRLQKP